MRERARLALVALALLAGGVHDVAAQDRQAIVIGSKQDTEGRLLAEIMARLVEHRTDLVVERRLGLGGTAIVFGALRQGQIDLYPEYTGTGFTVLLEREDPVRDPLRCFLEVSREFEARWQLEWLAPFGFDNSYELAMAEDRAQALGVTRISDLIAHQDELVAAVSHEFLNRADGFPGLQAAYGLHIGDVRGMEHGLAYEAIEQGRVDLVDAYTTDGKLLRYRIRVLEDDRRFFPPYDAAPLVRAETLRRYPVLREVLADLAFTIDAARMRRLNHRVEEQGGAFGDVAEAFLREAGLVDGGAAAAASPGGSGDVGWLAYARSRAAITAELALEHLALTLAAVLLATLFGVPVGIALTRRPALAGPVLGFAGVLQTVPSLALLAFMIPIPGLGLGARSAVAALFLYALLPILRNTYTGIREVDPALVEAARAMGLRDREILRLVQLPLATRTLMAGVRTSTVISVGVATLAAFIGAGGLGDPIVTGLQLDDTRLILSGAVPAALLAVVVDVGLGRVERALEPRGLRARS